MPDIHRREYEIALSDQLATLNRPSSLRSLSIFQLLGHYLPFVRHDAGHTNASAVLPRCH